MGWLMNKKSINFLQNRIIFRNLKECFSQFRIKEDKIRCNNLFCSPRCKIMREKNLKKYENYLFYNYNSKEVS